ncbi:substrate-binding periplasmic protein [Silvanigrella sp.]|uniref:substrate-binding periplasmic protein n=1 Tax=Silvanigrella sp. TaxID=2024976 RepID=UPI0037C60FCE
MLKKIININFINKTMIYLFILNFLSFKNLYAEDVTIITQEFPAKTEKWGEKEIGGIAGEIITKAFKDKNITFKVIWMPWKRSQESCLENLDKKTFIIPFTRNKERESNYIWTAKLYNADTVFVTYKGSKIINSFNEAKNKKIGVLLATSYELSLLNPKNGLNKSDIRSAPHDYINLKDLQDKSIYAWYTSIIGAYSFLRDQKVDLSMFDFGKKIETEENYIATAKSTDPQISKKVKNAIESFSKTA